MKIVPVATESFGANTYLIVHQNQALIVDPAVTSGAILEAIRAEDASPAGILLTHGHFDHVLSMDSLRAAYPLSVSIHRDDADFLADGRKNAFSLFFHRERSFGSADHLLEDGDRIPLGNTYVEVIHTPGHTPGSVCYLCDDSLLTGDTLFADTYGRCDLYGGSEAMMAASLASLRNLNPRLTVYPGHGRSETLGNALDTVAYLL
ncbi:MAG: MBL fold metallo-hydrolase [Clostridia bacterium]|nr:MBL fold metallo-hydrolase [Clostridia bacterium]